MPFCTKRLAILYETVYIYKMGTKLVSRIQFADMAGMSVSGITKSCKTILLPAMLGQRVNVEHPVAKKYLEDHAKVKETGRDIAYAEVVGVCIEKGKFNTTFIRNHLGCGLARARKILSSMERDGLVPGYVPPPAESLALRERNIEPTPPSEDVVDEPPLPSKKLRGNAALREAKKALSSPGMAVPVAENLDDYLDMTLRNLVSTFGTDTCFLDWVRATKTLEDINEKRLKNAEAKGELVSRDLVKVGVIEPVDSAMRKLLTNGAKTIAVRSVALIEAGRSVEDVEKFVIDQISSYIRPMKDRMARCLTTI